MPSLERMDDLYMDIADRVSQMSYGVRAKVGAVLVQGDLIISYGWNGMPAGDDNTCETLNSDGTLTTKSEVLHSESNCLMKLASTGGVGAQGATLYVTMSPCKECAKMIKQAKIKRVVYREQYRDDGGIAFLTSRGVKVDRLEPRAPEVNDLPTAKLPAMEPLAPAPVPAPKLSLLQQTTGSEIARMRAAAPVQASVADALQPPAVQAQPTIINDEAAALAAAGIVLVNGVPVDRAAAPAQAKQQEDGGGYRSSFL